MKRENAAKVCFAFQLAVRERNNIIQKRAILSCPVATIQTVEVTSVTQSERQMRQHVETLTQKVGCP